MQIVTGYIGEPHITSDDQQALNKGVIGDAILPIGEFRVEPGTYDDVAIDNGTQGMNRIDLVCARYQKDGSTGVESMSWAVVKGTSSSGTPSAPSYTTGDIIEGATDVYFPMYRVRLTGLAAEVTELCSVLTAAADNQATIASLPRALIKSSVVVISTASDDITLWTVPSGYDTTKIVVTVTNTDYATNKALPIATYIDPRNRILPCELRGLVLGGLIDERFDFNRR